jgi:hypothetical protein
MSNSYTLCTATRCVPCTKAQASGLNDLLEAHQAADLYPGFEIEWDKKDGAYFVTSDSSTIDDLSEEFLKAFGALIGAADLPYLEVTYACTCDKLREDSHSGGAFRIYPDGRLVDSVLVWPDPILVVVNGGVAEVINTPDDVVIDIVDLDNLREQDARRQWAALTEAGKTYVRDEYPAIAKHYEIPA